MPDPSTPDEPSHGFEVPGPGVDVPGLGFDEFAGRAGMAVPAADIADVQDRARRRRASGWAIAAAAVTVLAAPVAVYAVAGRPAPPGADTGGVPVVNSALGATPEPIVTTAAKPSTGAVAATSPPAGTGIEATDWANATLAVPANETGCAAGTAVFHHAVTVVGGTGYHLGSGQLDSIQVAYGDVDADGRAEALLVVSCVTPSGRKNPPSILLLVGAKPTVHTMALSFSSSPRAGDGEGKSTITRPAIHPDGGISFDLRTFEGNGQCDYHQRWTGTALTGACEP